MLHDGTRLAGRGARILCPAGGGIHGKYDAGDTVPRLDGLRGAWEAECMRSVLLSLLVCLASACGAEAPTGGPAADTNGPGSTYGREGDGRVGELASLELSGDRIGDLQQKPQDLVESV